MMIIACQNFKQEEEKASELQEGPDVGSFTFNVSLNVVEIGAGVRAHVVHVSKDHFPTIHCKL